MPRLAPAPLSLTLVLLTSLALAAGPPPDGEPVAGAKTLEARLVAPCCWAQTLDVHESPLASSLRAEIRERLRAGESAESIEEDFAARHGERVRAFERGHDNRGVVPLVAGIAALLGALALCLWMRRWTQQARDARTSAPAPPAAPDEYDARLDDELARLDG